MATRDQQFIAHCLKQGYISMDDVSGFIDSKLNKEKNAILFIARKLGWDKDKVREELRLSQVKKTPDIESTVAEEEINDDLKRTLGKYILVRKIGSGGMGTVYKAYHPELETSFAIKTIASEKTAAEYIERFKREAKISSRLRHPNIVRVYDVGIENGQHYIVMDYIEGKDLSKLMKEENLLFRRAIMIILKIGQALDYAHQMKVIHRDIKPSNILIADDEEGTPYLMDFGLASIIHKNTKLTKVGQVMGTPQYMSPEQAMGKAEIDGRSDIYSLGAVLYEMLTEVPAVKAESHFALICHRVVNEDPVLPSKLKRNISRDLEAITMKCLEKNPWRRYQTAGDLARDIERYLEGEAVLASSPNPLYKFWRKRMRNWKLTTVILASILLLTCVVTLWILTIKEQTKELERTRGEARNSIKRQALINAQKHEESENLKEAGNTYKEILEFEKDNNEAKVGIERIRDKIEGTFKEAMKNEREKSFDKALDIYKKLIKWAPEDGRFSKCLMELTQNRDQYRKKAREYYDRAVEVFWNPRLDEGELQRCKDLFEKAIETDPTFVDAHFQAGRASHRLLKTEEALKHYKTSLMYDPNLTPPKYYITVLYLSSVLQKIIIKEGDFDEFNKKFEDIWGHSPERIKTSVETTDPYLILGKAFFLLLSIRAHKSRESVVWNECLECCNKVIKDHPNFSDAYIIRAQLYSYWIEIYKDEFYIYYIIDPVDIDQALEDCSHALYLDPSRKEVYALRGAIYKSIGAYDIAEKDYTRALLLKQGSQSGFYIDRATCYIAMGKMDLAIGDLEKNLELLKSVKNKVKRSEGFLWKAILKSWVNEKKEAEKALNDYLSFHSSYSDLSQYDCFAKGLIYLFIDDEFKRSEAALRVFLKANSQLFNLFQIFFKIVKNMSPDHNIEDFAVFLREFPNLFCISPRLKKLSREAPDILSSFSKSESLQVGMSIRESVNLLAIAKEYLKNLNKLGKNGEEKHNRLNMVFNQEYPPLTADSYIYLLDYMCEKGAMYIILNLKKLPSASLYYRRAVEFYFRSKLSMRNKKVDDNNLKEADELEKARNDLKAALELEPCYMEAHYGLATVYSLLSESYPAKKAHYKDVALYHLKQAIENGWEHLDDYTLKDDDFSPLGLGKEVSLETLHTWDKEREENKRQIKRLENKIKDLISRGESLQALQLLYEPKPVFFSSLKDLLESTQKSVTEDLIKELKKGNALDFGKKLELLFGERGRMMWEEAKIEMDSGQNGK